MEAVRILGWMIIQCGRGISLANVDFLKVEIIAFIPFRK